LDKVPLLPCLVKLIPASFFKTSNTLFALLFAICVESIIEIEFASSSVLAGVLVAVITTSVSL
jgi:hypothetical protein